MKIKYLGFGLIIILGTICVTQYPKLSIITGFSAKSVCSCTFVSNRTLEAIEKTDNANSPINLAKNVIDFKNKSVTSTVFGLKSKTAIYREGFGCTLIGDANSTYKTIKNTTQKPVLSDTLYWPFGTKERDTLFSNGDYTKLKEAVNNGFQKNENGEDKTRSILVVYKGQIIAEKYADGYNKDMPLLGWSMTKSFMNTLVGVMVKNNNFDINAPLNIPEWKNDERSKITMNHLLHMNSGLAWDEVYDRMSDVTKMLFEEKDMAQYARNCKADVAPNKKWLYSSGTSNLIGSVLKDMSPNDAAYINMPFKEIFNPLGMNSATIEVDAEGNFVASSYGFATTRDWAKYGLLYLHDGVWNNKRLLPEGWTKYTRTPAPNSKDGYGAHFWLNVNHCRYKDVPADMYSCNGYQGQRVSIFPSNDLVIVRMGIVGDSGYDFNKLLSEIVNSIKY